MPTAAQRVIKWIDYNFTSSSGLTQEWKDAASSLRSFFRKVAEENGFSLVSFNRGHFYVSGFMQHKTSGKYVYFSTSDVRFFSNWSTDILFRTAEHDKDYTGGRNNTTSIYAISQCLNSLLSQG